MQVGSPGGSQFAVQIRTLKFSRTKVSAPQLANSSLQPLPNQADSVAISDQINLGILGNRKRDLPTKSNTLSRSIHRKLLFLLRDVFHNGKRVPCLEAAKEVWILVLIGLTSCPR
jgi:hypothetical protein